MKHGCECDGYDAPFEARSIIMSERGTIATTITQYNDDSDGGNGGGAGGGEKEQQRENSCVF